MECPCQANLLAGFNGTHYVTLRNLMKSHTLLALGLVSGGLWLGRAAIPNAPPAISITSPTNDTLFVTGSSPKVTAEAADADGVVTNVSFYRIVYHPGPVADTYDLLASFTKPPYQLQLTNLQPGFLHIVARAQDDLGATTQSDEVRLITYTPVHFTSISMANGSAVLDFTGDFFSIEQSSDFKDWTGSSGNLQSNPDNSYTFTILPSTNSFLFFRARHVFREIRPLSR